MKIEIEKSEYDRLKSREIKYLAYMDLLMENRDVVVVIPRDDDNKKLLEKDLTELGYLFGSLEELEQLKEYQKDKSDF